MTYPYNLSFNLTKPKKLALEVRVMPHLYTLVFTIYPHIKD